MFLGHNAFVEYRYDLKKKRSQTSCFYFSRTINARTYCYFANTIVPNLSLHYDSMFRLVSQLNVVCIEAKIDKTFNTKTLLFDTYNFNFKE